MNELKTKKGLTLIDWHICPRPHVTLRDILNSMYPDPLKGVNIDAEYELIKQKKSKLSANMRALVVQRKEADRG